MNECLCIYRLQPALQNLLQRVVWFFHPRSSCLMTLVSADVQRITLNASCMTISGERTEQLDIFCCVTGFTSDFLSFIVVELIQFFHGALQFSDNPLHLVLNLLIMTVIDLRMAMSSSLSLTAVFIAYEIPCHQIHFNRT